MRLTLLSQVLAVSLLLASVRGQYQYQNQNGLKDLPTQRPATTTTTTASSTSPPTSTSPTTKSSTTTTTETIVAQSAFSKRLLKVDDDVQQQQNTLGEDPSQVFLTSADELRKVPDASNPYAYLSREEQVAPRIGSDNQITFGRLDDSSTNYCAIKTYIYEDIVYDEVMQCQMDHEEKCFDTQETTFESFSTEVCDETFTKVCSISFLQETSPVTVQVCYNKAGKVCDDDLNRRKGRQADPSTCVDVYETICDTVTHQHVVQEDVANCKQEKQEVCLERDGCPTVPKTTCTIHTQNVTKAFTDTQCKKVLKKVCGPDECPIRFLPEICTNETRLVTTSIPMEKCELIPKKDCREISALVPGLKQAEKCMDIPKEICSKVETPRKVNKTSSKMICPDTGLSNGSCTTDTFRKDNGSLACYFFIDEGLTQSAAAAKCAALGARLPEINSDKENADVMSLMPQTTDFMKGIWLGCIKNSVGDFSWASTGQKIEYNNYDDGEPNNYDANENCMNMHSNDRLGKWNDFNCNNEDTLFPPQFAMCENIF